MSTRLHIGNLSVDTTEDTLRTLFAADSRRVDQVSVVTDPATGRSRGFGFVQMGTPEEAVAAIAAVNGQEVDGRRVNVSEAKPRSDRERL